MLRAIAIHVAILLDAELSHDVIAQVSREAKPSIQADLPALDLAAEDANELLPGSDSADRDTELARTICDVMSNEMDPESLVRKCLHAVEIAPRR